MDERFEYYWENGRLVEYTNHRNGNRGRWKKPLIAIENLVVAFHRKGKINEVLWGPLWTPERYNQAFLRFTQYDIDPDIEDLGPSVPEELVSAVSQRAAEVANYVTAQWESCGNEEGQTGFFSGLMNTGGSFRFGDWEATVRLQAFSPQTKEPEVGADIGIIVDMRRSGYRVAKAALIQAKRTDNPPDDPMALPDLRSQIADMQKTTRESYGLVYSQQDTYIFSPDAPNEKIGPDLFFVDMIRCRRGDRREQAVAQAYDRSIVIDVSIAT